MTGSSTIWITASSLADGSGRSSSGWWCGPSAPTALPTGFVIIASWPGLSPPWVNAEGDGWQVCAPVPFSTICFRHVPDGETDEDEIAEHNAAIMVRVNESGRVFLSHTKLGDQYVLRVAIGNLRTTEATLATAWALLRRAAP